MDDRSALCFIHLKGEYHGSDSPKLQQMLAPAEKADTVIVNLRDVTCFDMSCFFQLLSLRDAVVRRGGSIRIVMQSEYIKRLFMIGEIEGCFEFFESLDEALRFQTELTG